MASPPHSISSSSPPVSPVLTARARRPSELEPIDDDPVLHTLPITLSSTSFPIFLLHHNTPQPPTTPVEARLKPKSKIVQLDYPLAKTYTAKEKLERWKLDPRSARNTFQARVESGAAGANASAANRFVGRIVDGKVRLVRIAGEGHLGHRLGWLDEEVEREKKLRGNAAAEGKSEEAKGLVLSAKGEGQMSKLQKATRDEEGEVWRRMRWATADEAWDVFENCFPVDVKEELLTMEAKGKVGFLDSWI